LFYWFLRGFFQVVSKIFLNVRVEGAGNVPETGPLVVCANHVAWWDPVLVSCSNRRVIHWMAKGELFRYPIFGPLLKCALAFPVDRGKPDMSAVRDSLAVLKGGGVVGIFPEGTRQRGRGLLGEMLPGAALIALRGRSPVVPVAIRGRYGFRNTVRVAYGKPFALEAKGGRASRDMEDGSRAITEAITTLWEGLAGQEVA
jgi:1-acyl-sn-glycerol-3-phosphate acyltransferase